MFSIEKETVRAPLHESPSIHHLPFGFDVRARALNEKQLHLHQRPFGWQLCSHLHGLAVVLVGLEDEVAFLSVFARIHEPLGFPSTLRLWNEIKAITNKQITECTQNGLSHVHRPSALCDGHSPARLLHVDAWDAQICRVVVPLCEVDLALATDAKPGHKGRRHTAHPNMLLNDMDPNTLIHCII